MLGVEQHPVSVAKKTKVSIHLIVLDLSAFCGFSRVLPSESISNQMSFIQIDQKFKWKSPGSIHLEVTTEWLCWFRHHLLDVLEACQMLEELRQEDSLFEQELAGESLLDQRSISS